VAYIPGYIELSYPYGDVPYDTGVCTDVVVRAYRNAFDFDLQKAVHEDMTLDFSKYPNYFWTLTEPDPNIDHRRVPNLRTYFTKFGTSIAVKKNNRDYSNFLAGDIVTWRWGSMFHIGIISKNKNRHGEPLIIHNNGGGTIEEDYIFAPNMTGHYRFNPDKRGLSTRD